MMCRSHKHVDPKICSDREFHYWCHSRAFLVFPEQKLKKRCNGRLSRLYQLRLGVHMSAEERLPSKVEHPVSATYL